MTTTTVLPAKPARGHFRCNSCKSVCSAKNGDWFISNGSEGQQVFFCKKCEISMKDSHKRAIPTR